MQLREFICVVNQVGYQCEDTNDGSSVDININTVANRVMAETRESAIAKFRGSTALNGKDYNLDYMCWAVEDVEILV